MGSNSLVTRPQTSSSRTRTETTSDMIETGQRKHVVWVNIPISRTVNSMVTSATTHETSGSTNNSPKRVRWSEDLTQIRDISPRYKPNKWRFQSPSRRSKSPSEVEPRCEHYICTPGAPCRMVAGSQSSPVSLDRGDRYRSSSRNNSSTAAASLRCSPQLQKVVYRAVNNNNNSDNSSNNNNNYWRADRSNLSLSIRPSFV